MVAVMQGCSGVIGYLAKDCNCAITVFIIRYPQVTVFLLDGKGYPVRFYLVILRLNNQTIPEFIPLTGFPDLLVTQPQKNDQHDKIDDEQDE
jgi:hypothetical protein